MTTALQAYVQRGGLWVALDRALGVYNRFAFPYGAYGTYKPGPTTSGIPAGSPPLTVQAGTNGVYVITKPGAVFDLIDFQCEVQIRALGVEISRSRFRGNLTRSTNGALVNINNNAPYNSGVCLTLYDSDIAPTQPSIWWDGIANHDYIAHRVKIWNCVDSFGVWGSGSGAANVKIYAPYAFGHSMFSPDPNHASDTPVAKTHNDVIQWQGGYGLTIVGANLEGYYDLAIGEANYSSSSPHSSGGGPNNSSTGPGYNFYYPNPNINGGVLQVSGLNGGNCSGLDFRDSWVSGANRVMTLSQNYPDLGSIRRLTTTHDHMAVPAMNVPTGMDTGLLPSLVLEENLYEDGTPIIVFHT